MNYIDLHNHTMWGVDDGIQEKEESLRALENARNDGIVELCATPHIIPGKIDNTLFNEINQRFKLFESIALEYGIHAYLGSEIMINYDLFDVIDNFMFIPMNNSKYLLVEFDLRRDITSIDYIDEYLQELVYRGYVPIIAHAERYFPKGIDLSFVDSWIHKGCIIQVNRTSLLGYHGKTLQSNTIKLLKNKMVSLVCSDAHEVNGIRIFKLSDCYQPLAKLIGYNNARVLLFDNPNCIINNVNTISIR